ncbi:MAG: glycosyltransferase family 39 protein [Planctomycetaceae bacterium]
MRYLLWTICLAMLLIFSEVFSRPLLPPDETRYISVAWEAHVRGDHLVSHLNSETYAHKPPLLFWLINAVWSVTGLNEYAARLVSPAAGIMCILLTALMARRLWPESANLHRCVPMMLASMSLWIVFCPVTMFDTLLTCCTLLALLGVLRAEAGAAVTGWMIAGVALGFGILSKGPVVLVHVVPAALISPWWSIRVRTSYVRWYLGCGCAIVIASAIALAWALPSAAAGGKAYGDELLFRQTTGRMVNSFSHRQPFWWYLPWLPLCLMPWISLGFVWRGMRLTKLDSPLKFLICWVGASLLILSLVSGKQIYYLLPMIPAFALIFARLATSVAGPVAKWDFSFAIIGTIGIGALPVFANHMPPLSETGLRDLVADWYAIPLMACGAVFIPLTFRRIESAVFAVGAAAILFFIIVIVSVKPTMWNGFDLRPLARIAASHEGGVAWYGNYHGQLNYLGGIRYVEETGDPQELSTWLTEHRNGMVIMRLPRVTAAALNNAGIDASNSVPLSPVQIEQITQILRTDDAFPGRDWQPTVMQLHWIRRGFPVNPIAVLRFDDPPD